jgi:hypothetical protein
MTNIKAPERKPPSVAERVRRLWAAGRTHQALALCPSQRLAAGLDAKYESWASYARAKAEAWDWLADHQPSAIPRCRRLTSQEEVARARERLGALKSKMQSLEHALKEAGNGRAV